MKQEPGAEASGFFLRLRGRRGIIRKRRNEPMATADPKREQKEMDWADRDAEEKADEYEKTYRDGSAVNECWAQDQENV